MTLDAAELLAAATEETGLTDYGDPTLPDRFTVAVEHLNSLGMDDAGIAAAITNAVHHATGIRVRNLPVRIEDLLMPIAKDSHAA